MRDPYRITLRLRWCRRCGKSDLFTKGQRLCGDCLKARDLADAEKNRKANERALKRLEKEKEEAK